MLPLMNYRTGFQRLYVAFTVAYIAVISFALPPDRLRFWSVPVRDSVDIDAPNNAASQFDPDAFMAGRKLAEQASQGPNPETPAAPTPRVTVFGDPVIDPPPPPPGVRFVADPTPETPTVQVPVESRASKLLSLSGILFLPPAFGYALLFFVIPWIYRGFRQRRTIDRAIPQRR
jgi:hypothetical protein